MKNLRYILLGPKLAKRSTHKALRTFQARKSSKRPPEVVLLHCSRCHALFADYLARCPECGSDEWVGLTEINPYARVPMDSILKVVGHMLWLLGTLAFLWLLWQTGAKDADMPWLIFQASSILVLSILTSVAYFGGSEILRRILRIQRRLRAFHEHFRDDTNVARPRIK